MSGPDDDDEDSAEGPLDLVIEDGRWEAAGLEALAGRAIAATLAALGAEDAVIVVLGCDDARIAALNGQFRGKEKPTNVLSWPTAAPEPRAPGAVPALPGYPDWGDIAISYDTCAAEAEAQGKPFAHHVIHLIAHATLHLVGYDHEDPDDAETMEATERSILASLDIPDPYRTRTDSHE